MNTVDFQGREKLIEVIDASVARPSVFDITEHLRDGVSELIRSGVVELPSCVYGQAVDRYARRQLYRSDKHGYSVIAMTWGPKQGTPIHDHSGMWCVEGVWDGALEIVQYERLDDLAGMARFRAAGSILATYGSAGSLIPPHEYHTITNPDESAVAVSLHIYASEMTECAVFEPTGVDDCYRRRVRSLGFDREG